MESDIERRGGRVEQGRVAQRVARWPLAALVAAALAVGACVVPVEDGGAGPAEPAPRPSGTGERADGTTTVEEFQDDIGGAVQAAEQYWTETFRASGEQFRPIRRIGAYQRDGEVSCGGQPIPRNNAVYCSAGDFIAYDVNFAVKAFRQVGDAFIYYLLGHEYAHGIQVRLGIRYNYTIQQELQADCMAGAFLGDSVRAERLTLAEGDLEEFREGLLAVGDDPSIPWFQPGAHGTAEQRTEAFFRGYKDSLAACDLG
ncbi:MAG TPA: neutral zinc metallopeptidase [Micromonosporaceae bacterium]|nr:neutral zinc metallopeptidase [Micromonosporaceae bacterium]